MPSHFTVVQYVPDVGTGERMNIGVIAFDDQHVWPRFLQQWTRVQQFAPDGDVAFLRDLAARFTESARNDEHLFGSQGTLAPERIQEIARTWSNSIEFTPPRGSLLD